MRWYLTVVLICISAMVRIRSILECNWWLFLWLPLRTVCEIYCPFSWRGHSFVYLFIHSLFHCCGEWRSLYVPLAPCQMCVLQSFSYRESCLAAVLTVFFIAGRLQNLKQPHLSTLLCFSLLIESCSKKGLVHFRSFSVFFWCLLGSRHCILVFNLFLSSLFVTTVQ